MDHVFLRLLVPFQAQYVWLATDLAVFYIGLRSSSRIVEGGLVPLSATGALETGTHRFGRTVTPFSPTIHLALTCVDAYRRHAGQLWAMPYQAASPQKQMRSRCGRRP